MTTIRTIAGDVRAEIDSIKGSRFLGELVAVDSEPAARAVIAAARERDPDATHHCSAIRLASGIERADDDGEPRDSAGAPILRHLTGADLTDVVCIVTRWYGGTKLGRGGLVRAYGDAAAAAIAAATIIERPRTTSLEFTHPYDVSAAVQSVMAAYDGANVDTDYAEDVHVRLAIPDEDLDAFITAMTDATAGTVIPEPTTNPNANPNAD